MKKLLAIILVVLMSVSVLVFTACNNNTGENSSSETRQSSSEDESSTRRRGDSVSTSQGGNDGSSSSLDDNGESTSSSNDGNGGGDNGGGGNTGNDNNGGNGGNNENDGGNDGSSSNYQPPSGSNVYGNYPYSYTTNVTSVAFDLTLSYTYVDFYIIDLPSPSLNGLFYDSLVDAEDAYNALSASDKGMVANYARLQEARRAYDDMASQEAISLINEMSEPSLDNLSQFASEKAKVQNLLDKMSSTSSVSNLSSYNTKVQNSSTIVINEFSNAVSAISSFEYSTEYKQKLDNADNVYQIVLSVGLQNQVTSQKATLDNMKATWNNRVIAGGIDDLLAELSGVDNLTENDKGTISSLRKAYRKLTAEQLATLPAETISLYNAYIAKAQTMWPEYTWYVSEDTKSGSTDGFFTVYKDTIRKEKGTLGSGSISENFYGMFDGETCSVGRKFSLERYIHFTTSSTMVLRVIANIKPTQGSGDLILHLEGTGEISRITISNQPKENTEYTFTLATAGNYYLTSTNKELFLYVLCIN